MNGIGIRPANISDIRGLLVAWTGLFAEDPGTRDPTISQDWPPQFGAQFLRDYITDERRLVLVAGLAGDIAGLLTANLTEPSAYRPVRVATLHSIYVLAAHRGSGLGAQLVSAFREWARVQQADRLAVTAYAANNRAIAFYQRNGFVPRLLELETAP